MNIDKRSDEQCYLRKKLSFALNNFPGNNLQLLNHLQLFQRSSVIARILHLQEVYEKVLKKPGIILQIGVHYGSSMAVFLSLRAIYEPYNYSRHVIGIDSFDPHHSRVREDRHPNIFTPDKYGQFFEGSEYTEFLSEVLNIHESENIMSNIKKWEILKGELTEQLRYLIQSKDLNIGLLYFDSPISNSDLKTVLSLLIPVFQRGTLIVPYSINRFIPTGELDIIREVFSLSKYKLEIEKSQFISEKNYIELS